MLNWAPKKLPIGKHPPAGLLLRVSGYVDHLGLQREDQIDPSQVMFKITRFQLEHPEKSTGTCLM